MEKRPPRHHRRADPAVALKGGFGTRRRFENHPSLPIERVNIYVHPVTSAEFKRWLERQGAAFEPAKGGHLWVMLRGRRAILPMHGRRKELKTGTVAAIKKQLGVQ
jgi:mRNA interferase HicA